MQILAHRGWSMDIDEATSWRENSPSAFDLASAHADIGGIEIDIRRHPQTAQIVLAHDPINPELQYTPLQTTLEICAKRNWQILIEFKECDQKLFAEVAQMIRKFNLQKQTVLFAFPDIAQHFPDKKTRNQKYADIKVGVIAEYPWQIAQIIRDFKSDVLLLGWDERPWTFIAFRAWWSIFDLRKIATHHKVQIIAGVAQSQNQLNWAQKIGIPTITADMHPVADK